MKGDLHVRFCESLGGKFPGATRLVWVGDGVNTVSEATFDALNRRNSKTVGQATTRYFYDGEHCVEEYDDLENLLRKFIFGQRIDDIRVMFAPDIADVDDDQDTSEVLAFSFHKNRIGSVTHITGPNQTVVEQYDYTPYGETTIRDGNGADLQGHSAIGNPWMFTGRRFDEETGLYHYRHRAYDPKTGRFLQRDPLGYVDGPSLYEYARSCPTKYLDPFGLDPLGLGVVGGDVQNDTDHTIRVLIDGEWHDLPPGQSDDDIGGGDVDAVHDPEHPQTGKDGELAVLKICDGSNARLYVSTSGLTEIRVSFNWFGGWFYRSFGEVRWVNVQKEFGENVKDP